MGVARDEASSMGSLLRATWAFTEALPTVMKPASRATIAPTERERNMAAPYLRTTVIVGVKHLVVEDCRG